jgi:hypothetical protein
MDEPVGRTIDGTPWEEPRGPHLPDPLTRGAAGIPPISWLFIALAVVAGIWRVVRWGFDAALPIDILTTVLGIVPEVAPFLFGAALFVRHRDAWSTHRTLVSGIVLLCLVELVAAIPTLAGGLVLETDGETGGMTVRLALSSLAPGVLTLIGLVGLGRGLSHARTQGVATLPRAWMVVILTAGIVLTIGSAYVSSFYLSSSALALDGLTLAYLVVSTVVGIAVVWAWAYMAAVTMGGRLGGDRPIGAWRFAAIGPLAILAAYAVQLGGYSLIGLTLGTITDPSLLRGISLGASGAAAMGNLALIAAFISGLPSGIEDGEEDEVVHPAASPDESAAIDDDGPLDGPTITDFGERPIR